MAQSIENKCNCEDRKAAIQKKIDKLTTKAITTSSQKKRVRYLAKIRMNRIRLGCVFVECPVHHDFA